MFHRLIQLLLGLMLCQHAAAQTGFGQPKLWNGDWKFSLSDDSLALRSNYDDSRWRVLSLPHDWSVEHAMSPDRASCTGYLPGGVAWYRKHFSYRGDQRVYVYFEGIYSRSKVYLNGHLLGYRPSGFASLCYDMTPYINKEGDNVLAVRVDHSQWADTRWYSGSGIYRDVWLVEAGKTHFALWGNTWSIPLKVKAPAGAIPVNFSLEVENPVQGLQAEVVLTDKEGHSLRKTVAIGSSGKQTVTLRVKRPHYWQLDNPYLYDAHIRLLQQGREIDRDHMKVGLRALRWDAQTGFWLNGKNIKVKGVCLHEDAGVLGNAVPRAVWERRLNELKAIGVNAIRMSHNPHAPMIYSLCDSMGLMVMDEASDEWEFPKRKWLEGWNVGTPGFQGTHDFFEAWIDRDVRDMVRRDRRHASIVMWSIGNEVDYPNDPYSHPVLDGSSITQPMYGGYNAKAPHAERIGKIAKRLAAVVRAEDTSRPVTGALAGVVMSNETEYPQAVDIVGYNYTESRYAEDHKTYPKRVIYGSENRHDLAAWKAVRDNDFIFGQFLWTGIDYLGESGRWPARGSQPGLLDFGGFRKPQGWWRASLWSTEPMAYIGTYPAGGRGGNGRNRRPEAPSIYAEDTWNYAEGQQIRVVCYTNQPQARLLLNGEEVGALQQKPDDTGIISWTVPFKSGKLEVEAQDGKGRKVATYAIQTSGRPYALKAQVLHQSGDLYQVEVSVVDEQGVPVKLADNNVFCHTPREVKLLGMENSDNQDVSSKTDNRERVFRGRMIVYLRGAGQVTFQSPLLQSCNLQLR